MKKFTLGDISYGFLPTPKLDELQENYISCGTDGLWGVPKTISDEQSTIIGTVVEGLSCLNYNYVIPVFFDVTMKSRLADSPDDAEILQLIADTRAIGFAFNWNLEFGRIIDNLITSNQEVASYCKQKQKPAGKVIKKLADDIMEME